MVYKYRDMFKVSMQGTPFLSSLGTHYPKLKEISLPFMLFADDLKEALSARRRGITIHLETFAREYSIEIKEAYP